MEAYSRRLVSHTPLYKPPTSPASPATTPPSSFNENLSSFDANVITVLAILLCSMIAALTMNTIVRLILRCFGRVWLEPEPEPEPSPAPETELELGLAARLARAGFKRKAVQALPTLVYSADGLGFHSSECAICLMEFVHGERVRVLPECSHGFHLACVDRWLVSRSSCPTCRRGLFGACSPKAVEPVGPEEAVAVCGASEPIRPRMLPSAVVSIPED